MSQLPIHHYTAAGGVITTDGGRRVLVLLRSGRVRPGGRPEVRLPKGHVEPGENHAQAALREVREEAGLAGAELVADLGRQRVEFDYGGRHVVREEHYYLLAVPAGSEPQNPESQFQPRWLSWDEALQRLTFEAEREWLRRARAQVEGRVAAK